MDVWLYWWLNPSIPRQHFCLVCPACALAQIWLLLFQFLNKYPERNQNKNNGLPVVTRRCVLMPVNSRSVTFIVCNKLVCLAFCNTGTFPPPAHMVQILHSSIEAYSLFLFSLTSCIPFSGPSQSNLFCWETGYNCYRLPFADPLQELPEHSIYLASGKRLPWCLHIINTSGTPRYRLDVWEKHQNVSWLFNWLNAQYLMDRCPAICKTGGEEVEHLGYCFVMYRKNAYQNIYMPPGKMACELFTTQLTARSLYLGSNSVANIDHGGLPKIIQVALQDSTTGSQIHHSVSFMDKYLLDLFKQDQEEMAFPVCF